MRRTSRWVVGVLLAAISLNGCGGGIRLRSNVTGAAVRMDGENSVVAIAPGVLNLLADKPHVLTFSAPGYEDGKVTLIPRCSHGLAVLLIVGDIFAVPAILGVIGLIIHSARIASDPYFPGVYDEEEIFVELKPSAGSPESPRAPAPSSVTPTGSGRADATRAAAETTPPPSTASRFCTACGAKIEPSTKFCKQCGAKQ